MKGVYIFICFNLLLALFLGESSASQSKNNGVYIVYMGASRFPNGTPRNDHAQLLSSLIKRNKNGVLHTYNKGFSGFAARLSGEEAKKIAQEQGVISVFPDPILKLHTTRSWDFLKHQIASGIDSSTPNSHANGTDTIIGILDTGIWPESESFNDADMGPIPSRWKGICMEGKNFSSSSCNRKLIGARYYDVPEPGISIKTPRDEFGHGTHVASTAAGRNVYSASYYGIAQGKARGGSPGSRIAMYRVCDANGGCPGSALLKAFDDAIADGVDIISLSIGDDIFKPERLYFATDTIAIGAFHAVERGIVVVCSAGNGGPSASMVENVAPWILTVAATTIDRDYEADIVLGGGNMAVIKGYGINFSNLKKSPVYPLIDGSSAKSHNNHTSEDDASNCVPGSLDGEKIKGKILVCGTQYQGDYEAFDLIQTQGVVGLIFNDARLQEPPNFGTSPVSVITNKEDADDILSYIKSNSNPLGTILPTVTTINYKPAPVVAGFSSRGPTFGIQNLLKPDIAAPGVAILAAWPPNVPGTAIPGRDPPVYFIRSGTSMSCPHVSGLAATVKAQHPTWSPSAIRSAIMTSAIQTNNLHAPITTETGSRATPYDIGAGQISISGPLQPGLVYDTETMDYIQFLCNFGYNTSMIKMIALDLPKDFSCPVDSNSDSISNMNYPSIAISNLHKNGIKTVYRTVTDVGEEDESTYTAVVEAPAGVEVEVVPNKLQFTKDFKKLQFQVTFNKMIAASDEDLFGSITWSNGKYRVRSPFVVSSA